MPKWVYPLAFVFLLYLIYNDAGTAGQMAHGFAGLVGDIFGALGEFLTGLFEGGAATPDNSIDTSSSGVSGTSATSPDVTLVDNTDTFGNTDHTHVHNHD